MKNISHVINFVDKLIDQSGEGMKQISPEAIAHSFSREELIVNFPVGFVRFHCRRDGQTIIYNLVVDRYYRHQGWGRLLFYKILCHAIEKKQKYITLKAPADNSTSEFLSRLGFKCAKTEAVEYRRRWHWRYKIHLPFLIYCADGGRNRYGRIAKQEKWMLGLRSDAPAVSNHVHFVDVHFKDYSHDIHLARVQRHKPLIAAVKDVDDARDVGKMLNQIEEMSKYCGRVLVVPKALFVAYLKENVWFGYSIPTMYGATDIAWQFFGDRPTHLLGGSPDAQVRLARIMNVVSLNSDYALYISKFGQSVYPGVGSGISETKGCYNAFEISMRKQRQYWRNEGTFDDLPLFTNAT